MEQLVRILKTNDDGTARVIHIRESACSGDCHKCSGCGAVQQSVSFIARNPINAKPGDLVTVRAESGPVLLAAAVLYMLPVALFFAGYLVGQLFWDQGAILGCTAFGLGIAAAVVYDRLVAKKKETIYTIIGYPHNDTES